MIQAFFQTLALISMAALPLVTSQSAPSFYTYSAGVFTCDYGSMVTSSLRPIDFTQFNPVPQRLVVKVNGYVPFFGDSQTFSSTFSTIDTSQFDPNYPATLTLDCGWSGSLFFESGAFYNMSYIQSLKIRNCNTYNIPSACFADLQELDYFGFENGLIDTIDPNAMSGLTLEKLTSSAHSFPQTLGHFDLRYTQFQYGFVPPGLLFSWKNLTSVTLRGAGISSVSKDVFQYNVKLRYIDLSDNTFTSLPSNVFSGLPALSEIHLYNINWTCSCDNNWFIEYADTNNISLHGDLVCSDPAITVRKFWYTYCVTSAPCQGVTLFSHCLSPVQCSIYMMNIVSFVIVFACLVVAVWLWKLSNLDQEELNLQYV